MGAENDLQPRSGHLFFPGDDRLEGILEWPDGDGRISHSEDVAPVVVVGGVVVAHPHPLYGGTMVQPVVYRIAQACREVGMATLRFNFRGVGRSQGAYSGVQEYRDVEAAASYLRARLTAPRSEQGPGLQEAPIAMAGYSFGSVMAAMAASAVQARALALVAFVVGWEEMPASLLERLRAFRGPVLAVCGGLDDLAAPRAVERVLAELGLDYSMSVVQGADHLFEDAQRDVGSRVATFLKAVFTGG